MRKLVVCLAVFGIVLQAALARSDGVLNVVSDAVGIGVETPAAGAKLHVRVTSVGPVDAFFLDNTTGPTRLNLQNLSIVSSATAEMTIDAAGNLVAQNSVTIAGTTLHVPDFVLEPNYKLVALEDVKSLSEKNRRLPEVPSAEAVSRESLNMTHMQMRLLQKVEELTPYTLQQQETIKVHQAQIAALERKIR